ncbi:hypothetical protein ABB02_00771 [Clostridiaceae bacterium JG1575]|nr:hypothetical protein ABB02_00771 [Clostridiaceae bacterium JG1575]
MKELDCRGLVCPQPVIETKKALKSPEGVEGVTVRVDNLITTQNLAKMAQQMNLPCEVESQSETDYSVRIGTGEVTGSLAAETVPSSGSGYVVAISGPTMGDGAEELGKKLLGSFLYSLSEQDELPRAIVFYNGGVAATLEGSPALEDLKLLSEKGVEILSCGLCLNYYGWTEQLAVGEVTNMYRITELLRTHAVVRP